MFGIKLNDLLSESNIVSKFVWTLLRFSVLVVLNHFHLVDATEIS